MEKSRSLLPRLSAWLLLLPLLFSCTPTPQKDSDGTSESESESIHTPTEPVLINLFSPDAVTEGSLNTDGSISAATDRLTSAPIPVTTGETLYFGPAESGAPQLLVFYKEDGSFLRSLSIHTLSVHSRFLSGDRIYSCKVPADAATLRVSLPSARLPLFTVSKTAFDSYFCYRLWEAEETGNLFLSSSPKYPAYISAAFTDKRALFLGASICAAGKESDLPERGYCGRIAVATGLSVTNRAMSGASFSTIKGENRILSQYEKVSDPASYDYIILHSGVNDAWGAGGVSAPVGEVARSHRIEDFDTSTYAGALEEMFATLRKEAPDAEIGYILSHQSPYHTAESIRDMSAYHAVAKEICAKWSVPYLNMYDDAAFNALLENDTTNHLYDKLHPGTTGYDILYMPIMYWMEAFPASRKLEYFPSDFTE